MKIESLREFADTIVSMLRDEFDERYEITSGEVLKNNSVRLYGITIKKPNEVVGPRFYVNEYYKDFITGRSLSDIVRQIIEIYQTAKYGGVRNFVFPIDFENAREHICFRVVNAEKNRELLSKEPFVPVLDLALEFVLAFDIEDYGSSCVRIRNEMLDSWGVDANDLIKEAIRNTPRFFPIYITTMWKQFKDILIKNGCELCPDIYRDYLDEMLILSNKADYFGATGIFYEDAAQKIKRAIMENRRSEMPSSVIVLPASVHEIILIPEDQAPKLEEMLDMIRHANESTVKEMEFLSEHPYRFNLETGRLEILSEENKLEKS